MKKLLLLGVLGCVAPLWGAPQNVGSKRPAVKAAKLKWPTLRGGVHWKEVAFEPGVAAIQYQLRARSFYKGKVDGLFSPKTVTALKAFQKSKGLRVDGIAGPQTLPLLVIPVRRGSKGDAVRAAQILARIATDHSGGMPNLGLEVDGVYGEETEEAVRTHQACLYLQEPPPPETGIMDLQAWSAMLYDFQPQRRLPVQVKVKKELLTKSLIWPAIPSHEELYDEYYSPNLQALQYLLRSRGFFKGTVNGLSGQKTTASIKAFQRAKHLPITGIARQRELQLLVVPLQPGAKGDKVRATQILARAAYGIEGDYPNLGLGMDGYYGAQTVEAIRRAQKGLNQESTLLPVNGIMTTRTWCLLMNGRVSQ